VSSLLAGFSGDRKYVVVVVVVVVLVVVDVVVVVVVVEFLSSGVSNCVTIFWAHLQQNKTAQLFIPLKHNSYLSKTY
jgi:hypothetical protein